VNIFKVISINKMVTVLMGLGLAMGMTAHAAELTLISGGAVEPGVHAAVHAFEKASGHKVKVTFNTTPQMQKRVASGDIFDVIIAPPAATGGFAKDGKVDGGGLDIGRVGSGVAVRPGAPVPAIDALLLGNCRNAALLAAFERALPSIESAVAAGERIIELV